MTLAAIEERVKQIATAVEQSLASHNALLGRLAEAQHLYSVVKEASAAVAPIATAVAEAVPTLSPYAEEVAALAADIEAL